jgi:sulfhydrogenase subunit beta (sulfur reductase)
MISYIVSEENIKKLVEQLIERNWNVVSQTFDRIKFDYINDGKDLVIDANSKPSNLSMKEFYFPKSESLFYFKRNQNDVELSDPNHLNKRTAIFGAKPCDSAAIPILNKVFNWDYHDEFFNIRVENSVIIGMACNYSDDYCFCTSVGLSPYSEKGSDIFLDPLHDNFYLVKAITKKGEEFISEFVSLFNEADELDLKQRENNSNFLQKKFEIAEVKKWLDLNFQNDFWKDVGIMCLGCAQCVYVCPTCHCFDIVDEDCSYNCGRRAKNWDACQFNLFTKHASGHNPRENQEKRYRQRVSHKFKYYKDRFGEILCTGCGRCSRGCAIGIDIGDIMKQINVLEKSEIASIA